MVHVFLLFFYFHSFFLQTLTDSTVFKVVLSVSMTNKRFGSPFLEESMELNTSNYSIMSINVSLGAVNHPSSGQKLQPHLL